MAFKESVTVTFGADVGPFQRGLATINAGVTGLKHELEHFGGRSLGHTLGIFGVIEGFKKIYEHAKEAREEADKTGEAMSNAARMVAQIGDGWDTIKHKIGDAGVAVLGFIGGMGSIIGQLFGTASSPKDIESLRKAEAGQKGANEKGLTPEQEKKTEETRKRVAEARDKFEKESHQYDIDNMKAQRRLNTLKSEYYELGEKHKKTVAGTLPDYKISQEMLEKMKAIDKARLEVDKERTEELKKQEKYQEAAAKVADRQLALNTHRADMFLPGLNALGAGRGPGSSLAKMAEHFETLAIQRSGSAPGESARFAERALQLRHQLTGRIKSQDADPLAADVKELRAAVAELKEIKQALKPVGTIRK